MEEENSMCSNWQGDQGIESDKDNKHEKIAVIPLNQLKNFKNHPFKVELNTELFELMQSIEKEGMIVPILARPNPKGEGFEIISGHRRKAACEWAGIADVPVVIRNLDNEQAVIAMVDSNLQRENIKPSEKAFAYKMKLEAMKHQGKRMDLSSDQVGPELENSTVTVTKLEAGYDEQGLWSVYSDQENFKKGERSNEILSKQVGESVNQIKRYIRLTYLIPKILDKVDEEKIAFTVAVELSYLNEEEQYELNAVMELEQCTPSLSQANRLKRMSQAGNLDMDAMYDVLGEEKPNQKVQIKIQAERLDQYFPSNYTDRQKVELIEKLVKSWHDQRIQKR
ncbi:ParB/RepB/Spo0J family partition protein [[Clostridium] fimetarium]|uniref:Chromosome partitioning protein, ParB family n=1 Tax=[Clostridium] fimetarium TaxID=99656 RepID=A0A1I0MAB5_9FIRM|nr:ParB/RepB/Spo0J family partition protein [[Clostridium] fimetarium]SEV84666.1 chromosome partitioning protein, ParB family [[Clostridium] fimetarium]